MTASMEMESSTEMSLTKTTVVPAMSLSSALSDDGKMSHQKQFLPTNDEEMKNPALITPSTLTGKTSGNSRVPSRNCLERSLLYGLPKCAMPPPKEYAAIETFVENAIQSQASPAPGVVVDPLHAQSYKGIIIALKRPNDPPLLRNVLLALRTAGHGRVLNQLLLGDNHAQLIHLIIKFPSTRRPNRFEETASGDLADLLSVYDDNSLCDAHFQLLLAMVSAKSTNVVPVMRAVWRLLTAYGPLDESL
jgi:hypothetical protein